MVLEEKPRDEQFRHAVSSVLLREGEHDLGIVKPHEYQSRRFFSSSPLGEEKLMQKSLMAKPQNLQSKQSNPNIFFSLLKRGEKKAEGYASAFKFSV